MGFLNSILPLIGAGTAIALTGGAAAPVAGSALAGNAGLLSGAGTAAAAGAGTGSSLLGAATQGAMLGGAAGNLIDPQKQKSFAPAVGGGGSRMGMNMINPYKTSLLG